MMLEASLSFLGIGVMPPDAVLGADDHVGINFMYFYWTWLSFRPWRWRGPFWPPRCSATVCAMRLIRRSSNGVR